MPTDPNALLTDEPGGIWLQRFVGMASFLVGLALVWLLVFFLFKGVSRPRGIDVVVFLLASVVGLLAAAFLSVGWRMTLDRPNKYGSILSPVVWFLTASLFFLCACFLGYHAITSGQLVELGAPTQALLFAVLSALAGWHRRHKYHQRAKSAA